ncbi:MAG: Rieske (2Fe-2S) protein [Coriobacteriia bacterium]
MSDSVETTDQDDTRRPDPASAPMERRNFLVWAAGASLGASAIFIGATVIQAMIPPARSVDGKKNAGKIAVARVSDLEVNKPHLTDYGEDKIFVVKASGTEVHVFDAACPHVGCQLIFNPETVEFDCPCHKSVFTVKGVRLRGPAPRNMISAVSQIVNGEVVVSGFRA